MIFPNAGLLRSVTGSERLVRLKIFVASARTSNVKFSRMGNTLSSPASSLAW